MDHKKDDEGKGTCRVEKGNRLQISSDSKIRPVVGEKIQESCDKLKGKKDQLEKEIGESLKRIELSGPALRKGMGLSPEDADEVETHGLPDHVAGREILPPLPCGEMPEDGENDEARKDPRSIIMEMDGSLEADEMETPVDLEPRDSKEHDQDGLGTVPEPLEASVE